MKGDWKARPLDITMMNVFFFFFFPVAAKTNSFFHLNFTSCLSCYRHYLYVCSLSFITILSYLVISSSSTQPRNIFNSYSLSQMMMAAFYSPHRVQFTMQPIFPLQTVMCTSCWKPGCNINIAKRLLCITLEGLDRFLMTEHLLDRTVMTTGND